MMTPKHRAGHTRRPDLGVGDAITGVVEQFPEPVRECLGLPGVTVSAPRGPPL